MINEAMKKQAAKKTPRARPPKKRGDSLIELLARNSLFSNVTQKTLQRIVPHVTQHQFNDGEMIFDENTEGRDMYLVFSGKVHIKKFTKYGAETLLTSLGEGNFFGELSLVGGFPRLARAEAVGACTIARLGYDQYQTLLDESNTFAQNLLRHVSLRLRTMDQMFVTELERTTSAYEAQVDRLHLLVEASKTVNSTIDGDELLGLILSTAMTSIRADRGTLYLLDPVTHELWSKIMVGDNLVEIRLPLGKGLAGYVAKTGETVNITDAYQDPRFNPEIDRKSGYKTHFVLCMPLRSKEGKIVGVFQLLNKRGGPFTSEDEEFIEALSVHAAIAIENTRMVHALVRNERLSAIGQMASTIIHDIKNPMATMRVYAQVIKNKTENAEAVEIAEMMIKQVDRFVNMTQEILDFSRGVSELNLEPIKLADLMPAIWTFLEHDLNKRGVSLVKHVEYSGTAYLDSEKILRVFQNIAGNAADAMPGGGSLTATIKRSGKHISFEWADTGAGMNEEVRMKAFEPFFSRGKVHGTGLGLSIVKKIIDDHKGSIEIDSKVGEGTTITILLPLPEDH